MASDIRSQSQDEIDREIKALTGKYSKVEWPFNTREVLSDCIASLGGLFAAQTSINHEPRRFYFFRVRTASSFNNEDETIIPAQFGHPPPEKCNRIGRAHIPSHPVFYASDFYESAIREMKLPNEQYYFISSWYTDEISIPRLNFLFADNICSSRLLDNFHQAVSDMWEQHNVKDDLNRVRIKAHLCAWSNLFLSENYSLTASIAHQNMFGSYADHRMICYGSAIDGKSVNYAVHPDLASKFKLHRVYTAVPLRSE